MTREERRKIRYAQLINAGLTPKQARELRDRSNTYILDQVGVRISSKQIAIKPLSASTKQKKQLEIKKYQTARERGLSVDDALQAKTKSWKVIDNKSRYITPYDRQKQIEAKKTSRRKRIDAWKRMSKKGNEYDDDIIMMAEYANAQNGFDLNASYGYNVAFYAYIENEPIEEWMKKIESDRFTEQAVYKTTVKS